MNFKFANSFCNPFMAIVMMAIMGCAMRTVITSGESSLDGKYRVSAVIRTERGDGYDERKRKVALLGIRIPNTEPPQWLFRGEFIFLARELDWDAVWESPDIVRVEFFEYPVGISMSSTQAIEKKAPRIPLARMVFQKDASSSEFRLRDTNYIVPK